MKQDQAKQATLAMQATMMLDMGLSTHLHQTAYRTRREGDGTSDRTCCTRQVVEIWQHSLWDSGNTVCGNMPEGDQHLKKPAERRRQR